jgi:hypothetical protein
MEFVCLFCLWVSTQRIKSRSDFLDFKKAYDSVRREVLYNVLIESGVPMKLVRLFKICLNETYSKVRIGKHLSENFSIPKTKDMLYRHCFYN